jgi:transaldolase
MDEGYFSRLTALSPTRLWINNPTAAEAVRALEAGAVACTTNPAYVMKMYKSSEERAAIDRDIDEAASLASDDAAVAVQRAAVKRLCDAFLPLYETSGGRNGWVSIQISPFLEHDAKNIVDDARENRKLAPNVIAKIPVTEAGLEAMGVLLREGVPIIATEVMGLSQAAAACGVYQRTVPDPARGPAFFVTHISGIFDDYLRGVAPAGFPSDLLYQAGLSLARRQYETMRSRRWPGRLLGGGARGLHHFTELIGGDLDVTINWKDGAQQLLESNPPVVWRVGCPVPPQVVDRLRTLPEFDKAWREDGLAFSEFDTFGPVALFRSQFIEGWNFLLDKIRTRRAERCGRVPLSQLATGKRVEIRPGVTRVTLSYNADSMLCHFSIRRGTGLPLHRHRAVQNGFVLKGRARFYREDGSSFVVGPGDGYIFDSQEAHGSEMLEDVELIECFSPMRPEYSDREDIHG